MRKIKLRDKQRHIYITGKTGIGKSHFIKHFIYAEIRLRKPKSAIVLIDPHGDMAEEIARFKEFQRYPKKDRLVYIDPVLREDAFPSLNPFFNRDKSERNIRLMAQEIKRILDVLLKGAGTSNQMDAVIYPCITTLLRKKISAFDDLQRFMDDKNNDDLIELGMQSPNRQHRLFFRNKFRSKALWMTKHAIYTRLQVLLNDPTFQNLISGSNSIDLESLIERKKIIIFKLTLGELGSESVEAYGRFIVAMLRIIALRRSQQPGHKRTPTFLFIDEFQNFVSEDLENSLTQLRKYRLYLILASQYVGQRIDKYLQKALFSVGVIIAGQNERKSRKGIEEETGILASDIEKLRNGEFWIKSGISKPFKMRIPKFLMNNSHSMSNKAWNKMKAHQVSKYYLKEPNNFDHWCKGFRQNIEGLFPKYAL